MVHADQVDDVLGFWFPSQIPPSKEGTTAQAEWWFRGGADVAIGERFGRLLEQAGRGELDTWSTARGSRLALIVVLDQFSRSVYRGKAQAFAQDARALELTLEGLELGHYAALETPWQKTFFFLPLGHSENVVHLARAVQFAQELLTEVPEAFRWWFDFSATQARLNLEVIKRFGRHPHRNELLGRASTSTEREYLATGQSVHTRPLPK